MSAKAIDKDAQRGAEVRSRRESIGGLAGVGMAAALSLVAIEPAMAKKKNKKTCKKQNGDCRTSVVAHCEQSTDAEACEETLGSCCELLKACDAGGFYDCLIDGLLALEGQ